MLALAACPGHGAAWRDGSAGELGQARLVVLLVCRLSLDGHWHALELCMTWVQEGRGGLRRSRGCAAAACSPAPAASLGASASKRPTHHQQRHAGTHSTPLGWREWTGIGEGGSAREGGGAAGAGGAGNWRRWRCDRVIFISL